jgi:hypothetical protein
VAIPLAEDDPEWDDLIHHQNRVFEQLGGYHMRQGDYARALAVWKAWPAIHWCGNCADSIRHYRREMILACLLHLGQHAEAAREAIAALSRRWEPSDQHDELGALLLAMLYERAGQRADLVRIAERLRRRQAEQYSPREHSWLSREEYEADLPAARVLAMVELVKLRTKSTADLVANCRAAEPGPLQYAPHPTEILRASLLGGRGAEAVAAIRAHLAREPRFATLAILSLAFNADPEADALLSKLARTVQPDDLPTVFVALRLRGPAGETEVERTITARRREFPAPEAWMRRGEREAIDYCRLALGWPPPAKGSLPKE